MRCRRRLLALETSPQATRTAVALVIGAPSEQLWLRRVRTQRRCGAPTTHCFPAACRRFRPGLRAVRSLEAASQAQLLSAPDGGRGAAEGPVGVCGAALRQGAAWHRHAAGAAAAQVCRGVQLVRAQGQQGRALLSQGSPAPPPAPRWLCRLQVGAGQGQPRAAACQRSP